MVNKAMSEKYNSVDGNSFKNTGLYLLMFTPVYVYTRLLVDSGLGRSREEQSIKHNG